MVRAFLILLLVWHETSSRFEKLRDLVVLGLVMGFIIWMVK